jgi:hypothetical protein
MHHRIHSVIEEKKMNVSQINPSPASAAVIAIAAAAAMALFAPVATRVQASASRTFDAKIVAGVLAIRGTNGDDVLVLGLKAGDANILELDVNGDGTVDASFDRSQFSAIKINARNGDDLVQIDEANGAIDEPATIRGGNGDDTILGGAAVDTIYGGNGDDFIDGNRGADVAFMGPGNDTFRWDPGDASDVVEGGDGSDTLLFNGANGGETVDLSANGERFTFFRNPGNITMDVDGVEISVFNALGGSDSITVNGLTGTDVTQVELNLDSGLGSGTGDGLADQVTVVGTAGDDSIAVTGAAGTVEVSGLAADVRLDAAELADRLDIDTGAGDDTVDASGLAAGVIQLGIDP